MNTGDSFAKMSAMILLRNQRRGCSPFIMYTLCLAEWINTKSKVHVSAGESHYGLYNMLYKSLGRLAFYFYSIPLSSIILCTIPFSCFSFSIHPHHVLQTRSLSNISHLHLSICLFLYIMHQSIQPSLFSSPLSSTPYQFDLLISKSCPALLYIFLTLRFSFLTPLPPLSH